MTKLKMINTYKPGSTLAADGRQSSFKRHRIVSKAFIQDWIIVGAFAQQPIWDKKVLIETLTRNFDYMHPNSDSKAKSDIQSWIRKGLQEGWLEIV